MSGSKSSASWHCPNCLRTVPARITTCYCGVRRHQVVGESAPAASRLRGHSGLVSILAAALGGGLLVTSFQRPEPSATPLIANQASADVSRPRLPPSPRATLPSLIAAATPELPPVSPVLRAPAPRIDSTPAAELLSSPSEQGEEEVDSVAVMRKEGTERLDSALAALRPKIQALESRVRTYAEGCTTSREALARGGCPTIKDDILSLRAEIERTISKSEETARRSWVAPGVRRDLLRQHGLDSASWGQLVASSERALAGLR